MSTGSVLLEDRRPGLGSDATSTEALGGHVPQRRSYPRLRIRAHDALLPLALVLWAASVNAVNPEVMNDFGLLPALPLAFFAAVAVLVASATFALFDTRLSPVRLGLHLLALIVILHATVPMIFSTPTYPWLYKHIGVADYINLHGRLDTTIDIYHNWPGFFALAAWLTRIAGVDSPLSYAAWAPVYFNTLACLMLAFAYRWLPVSPRVRWLASFLFVAGNWVGQDYFAPQAIAFVLSLAVFGMVLAWLGADRPPGLVRTVRRLVSLVRRHAPQDLDEPERLPTSPKPSTVTALAALFTIFTVLVFTHQLSPYFVVLGVGLLTLAGMVRPGWVVVVLAAVTMGYLLLHFAYVDRTQDLFSSLGDPLNNIRDASNDSVPMIGRRLTALAAPALILGLWTLALIGILRRLVQGRRVLVLATLAWAPMTLVVGQAYGGEAIFRIYLFSLPWTAVLAAFALDPRRTAAWRFPAARVGVLLAGTVALFLSAFYGSMELYVIRPGEVQASKYFYEHAEPGSVLTLGAANFPARLGARYDQFRVSGDNLPNLLTTVDQFRHHMLGVEDLPAISTFVRDFVPGGGRRYLALSTSQRAYSEVLGLLPKGSYSTLDAALSSSPDWSVFVRNADAVIYRLEPVPVDDGPLPPIESARQRPERSVHWITLALGLSGAVLLGVVVIRRVRKVYVDGRAWPGEERDMKGIDMGKSVDRLKEEATEPQDEADLLKRQLALVWADPEVATTLSRIPPQPHRLGELVAGLGPAARARGVRLLGGAWGPLRAEHLAPAMRDPAAAVRAAAIEFLEPSVEATAALHERLRDDLVTDVRVAAVVALAHAPEGDQLSALTVAVVDPDPRVRVAAFTALPAAGAPVAANAVLTGTRDEHCDVRHAAYRRLPGMPSWVLWYALDGCTDRHEVYAAVADESAERLERLALDSARSPDSAHRVLSVELADRVGTSACRDWTLAALRDPAPAVRRAAAAQMNGRSDAFPQLIRTLQVDPDPTVRRAAAVALRTDDGDEALMALVGALQDPDPAVRQVAIDVLPARRSPGLARRVAAQLTPANKGSVGQVLLSMGAVGEEALTSMLVDGPEDAASAAAALLTGTDVPQRLRDRLSSLDPPTRLRAVNGLGVLGGPEVVDGLVSALSDAAPEVRARAVFHLEAAGDPRGVRALESLSESDPVVDVARSARAALDAIHARAGELPSASTNGQAALGHPRHIDA